MENEIKSINIPSITVTDLTDRLTKLYVKAVESGLSLKKLPTPFLWGAAGIGKSAGVHQLSDRIAEESGKKVVVTDVRLLLFSPVDLRGVPTADAERRFTNWLCPKIFDMDKGEDVINILFLDELSAAPQSVQAAAYQICLDRRIGEHELPKNCIVIAAGNRTTDQSVSYKMPKALCNRLMHFNIRSDYGAWRDWAHNNGISDKVIAYLGFDSSRLCVDPESSDLAYCTPRSWDFVSTLLKTVSDDPREIHDLIASCVGIDTALEFEAFCSNVMNMPSIDKIFQGICREKPCGQDVLFALISGLVERIHEKKDSISVEELENVCSYVQQFSADFIMLFMRDVISIKSINGKLMRSACFQSWLNKNWGML